jgi:hypothetical protein
MNRNTGRDYNDYYSNKDMQRYDYGDSDISPSNTTRQANTLPNNNNSSSRLQRERCVKIMFLLIISLSDV